MALNPCHECGKDVSSSAAACPHCGAPPKAEPVVTTKKFRLKRWLPVLLIAGVVIGGGAVLVNAFGDLDKEYAKGREQSDDQAQARKVIDGWLGEQKAGRSGDRYWSGGKAGSRLFAVRNWEVVDLDIRRGGFPSTAVATVRVDSSTQGGMPITVLWNIRLTSTQPAIWVIDDVGEVSGRPGSPGR
ncbi:MAG: zinc ribbon domain-containing protein [Gemmataceae bacterium]|nr:zinc ribbon domain-containing protein [Gemmataceae bacterium]